MSIVLKFCVMSEFLVRRLKLYCLLLFLFFFCLFVFKQGINQNLTGPVFLITVSA